MVTQVQIFLGLAGFYRHFIKEFSIIAAPLHELTKKGAPFHWEVAQENAFNHLKKKLTNAPLLQLPDFGGPWRRSNGTFWCQKDGGRINRPLVLAKIEV